jgi:hypothetical protein
MLNDYPLELDCRNFIITVPEPAAYVLHKLLINPMRTPIHKKEKDISAVRSLLLHIKQSEHDKSRVEFILKNLSLKAKRTIESVCNEHFIEI